MYNNTLSKKYSMCIENVIEYQFKDNSLLERALTHRSKSDNHYEKLEFIGDSVLNLCISTLLYHNYPKMSEGELSIARSKIVNRHTLSKIGKQLMIDPFIRKEKKQSISQAIRADIIEALLGGVYLDGGLNASQQVVKKLFTPFIHGLDPNNLKDPKSKLQEYAHRIKVNAPKYQITNTSGKEHEKVYEVTCAFKDTMGHGISLSKRQAEMLAAKHILSQLNEEICE